MANTENMKSMSYGKQLLYTLFFNVGIGLFVTVAGMGGTLSENMIISNCIGFSICAWINILVYFAKYSPVWLATGAILGALTGASAGFHLAGFASKYPAVDHAIVMEKISLLAIVFGLAVVAWFSYQENHARVKLELLEKEAKGLESEKGLVEARLRLLQAQIEPHFLFNTLATIESEMESDANAAKRLVTAFTAYLRNSTEVMGQKEITLGKELNLIENHLAILKERFGERLTTVIDVDPAHRSYRLPPLLIQPLVENAVKYGIEPKETGGTVTIRSTVLDGKLSITVEDDGSGIGNNTGIGIGISNIRERLNNLYGADQATIRLEERMSGGVRATLELPYA